MKFSQHFVCVCVCVCARVNGWVDGCVYNYIWWYNWTIEHAVLEKFGIFLSVVPTLQQKGEKKSKRQYHENTLSLLVTRHALCSIYTFYDTVPLPLLSSRLLPSLSSGHHHLVVIVNVFMHFSVQINKLSHISRHHW